MTRDSSEASQLRVFESAIRDAMSPLIAARDRENEAAYYASMFRCSRAAERHRRRVIEYENTLSHYRGLLARLRQEQHA